MSAGRIVSLDEENFLLCLKYNLWGSNHNRLRSWKAGEKIIFKVDKKLAAYGEVIGESYYDRSKVWDKALYPYRIKIKMEHVLANEDRIPLLGEIRDKLIDLWGNKYGWGLINQQLIPAETLDFIIKEMQKFPCVTIEDIDQKIIQLKEAEKIMPKRKRGRPRKIITPIKEQEGLSDKDESKHTAIQHQLIKIGLWTDCNVWVATNDRGKKFRKEKFSDLCLKNLPQMGFDKTVMRTIEMIDVIWLKNNAPIAAFEVEQSTSIYSGLLRLSDLITLIPAIKIKLYIVGEKSRMGKVI